jgi:hypothetical protein
MKIVRAGWIGLVALAGLGCALAGCGGDDTGTTGGTDAAPETGSQPQIDSSVGGGDTSPPGDDGPVADTTVNDTSTGDTGAGDAGADSATGDAADGGTVEAGMEGSCSPDGGACTLSSQNALCKMSTCSACTDPTDDPACTSAYATDGGSFICNAGSCVAGNCHGDAGCAGGRLCVSNFCSNCTTDQQCTTDFANTICTTTAGASQGSCVTNACANLNLPCAATTADFCCLGATDAGVCTPGNCCTDKQCAATFGDGGTPLPFCDNNTCSPCPAMSGDNYFVDPVNGSDTLGTGGRRSGICAFKTVAHAISVINTAAGDAGFIPDPTNIFVDAPNTISTALTGESFPWIVPMNVQLASFPSTATVTAQVSAGTDGVHIGGSTQSIIGFIFDGAGVLDGGVPAANNGIVVSGPGPVYTTTDITNVQVRNFIQTGITVSSRYAALQILDGTHVTNNGTVAATGKGAGAGLWVTGTGSVQVWSTTATTNQVSFDNNLRYGILVDGTGSLEINGKITPAPAASSAPAPGSVGTVEANGNGVAGLAIFQDPTVSVGLGGTYVTQFVAANPANATSATASGILVGGHSNVWVRSSLLIGNAIGINITSTTYASNGTTQTSDDTSSMDFGSAYPVDGGTLPQPGLNLLQIAANADPAAPQANSLIGICSGIHPNKSQTLNAMGNTWLSTGSGLVNCATTAGTLSQASNCTGGISLGGQGTSTTGGSPNQVNVEVCTF